jgi:hypothetical protein
MRVDMLLLGIAIFLGMVGGMSVLSEQVGKRKNLGLRKDRTFSPAMQARLYPLADPFLESS